MIYYSKSKNNPGFSTKSFKIISFKPNFFEIYEKVRAIELNVSVVLDF